MIRRPIPMWLFVTLAAAGVGVAVLTYSGLSIKQTRTNPSQNVIPGIKGLSKGLAEISKSRGSEKKPKPSWIVTDAQATYWRLLLGLTSGTIASIIVGVAMGAYPAAEAFFSPVINFMAKIPPTAMLAVYMVVFGTKLEMYVALVAFGIFFALVAATMPLIATASPRKPSRVPATENVPASKAFPAVQFFQPIATQDELLREEDESLDQDSRKRIPLAIIALFVDRIQTIVRIRSLR